MSHTANIEGGALPYEEASHQTAIKGVIADLKERVGKQKVSRG